MKFFAVFAAVLAVAVGNPAVSTWTLNELSAAIQDPATDPAHLPYLQNALNDLMSGLIAGDQQTAITVSLPVEATMTLDELSHAVNNPSTSPALLPYYEAALHNLMVAMINGQEEETITLNIPAMNVNVWTLEQLSAALQNPETDPELSIYLEHALNELMSALFSGEQVSSIAVVTPPGVVSAVPEALPVVVVPEPVILPEPVAPEVVPEPVVLPEPVAPEVVPEPVVIAPEPVVIEESEQTTPVAASPLVQIIVNVNAQAA